MSPRIDSAILSALGIENSSTATIASHGGSGFSSTYRLTTTIPSKSTSTSVFVKTSSSAGAAVMFEGEHLSLNAIHSVVPSLCPRSFAWGQLRDSSGFFLATEFLDLNGGRAGGDSMINLAQKLAKLHSTPAPVPEGYGKAQYGFMATTCCGETPQVNTFTKRWSDFFAQNRLLAILERAEKNNGRDAELRTLIENVANKVVPRLLGDGDDVDDHDHDHGRRLGGSKGIFPVVVHGDLWSGNKGRGRFIGREGGNDDKATDVVEDVVYDPSATYAHSEYDHGIMNMFGGFDTKFWSAYFAIVPKTEPADEYDDRVALYESYHHLNHYAMFGGGYKSGAVRLLKPLVKKYGG